MDGITQLIVDLLRKKQETAALNSGGPTAGTMPQAPQMSTPPFALPQGREPKHGGRTYEEIVAAMGG